MRLLTAHRVLIVAGIALAAVYAAWELAANPARGTTGSMLRAAGAITLGVVLVAYYLLVLRRKRSPPAS